MAHSGTNTTAVTPNHRQAGAEENVYSTPAAPSRFHIRALVLAEFATLPSPSSSFVPAKSASRPVGCSGGKNR